jgi:hypothetical protein
MAGVAVECAIDCAVAADANVTTVIAGHERADRYRASGDAASGPSPL